MPINFLTLPHLNIGIMKNVIRIALVVFAFLFASLSGGLAQKTAHVNGNEVLALMAQKDSVGAKLEKLQAELTKELERLQVEYNRLLEDYNTIRLAGRIWSAAPRKPTWCACRRRFPISAKGH
jgi:hypothetical protein